MQSYVEYGQEADRIAALGRVVPVIFFLVAALVSLTAMTRMVEEQRTQIGMMKALGYSGVHIAMKYVTYALAATLSGSILGAVIGEKLLPWIIINAYKMMYTGRGRCLYAIRDRIFCDGRWTGGWSCVLAVLSACYKELREKTCTADASSCSKRRKKDFVRTDSIYLETIKFYLESNDAKPLPLQEEILYDDLWNRWMYGIITLRIWNQRFDFSNLRKAVWGDHYL